MAFSLKPVIITACLVALAVAMAVIIVRENDQSSSSSQTFEKKRFLSDVLPDSKTTTLQRQAGPPHIVFIMGDDHGYSDTGYHGSWIKTPNMDQLAGKGVKLENYYVQPICSPSRNQFLSGQYQIRTGLQHDIIKPCQPSALPLGSPTIADKLKEAGYSTHLVGKWHQGFYRPEYLPHKRGFDTFYGLLTGHADHYNHKNKHQKKAWLDLWANDTPVKNETGHYSTNLFTQKAMDTIASHDSNTPLFLFLSYQAVHGPVQVPSYYSDQYNHIADKKRKTYAGMLTCMDEGIGNVTRALQNAGIWNNTLLIYSTDNGGRVNLGASNYPLRGEKHSLWEGGIKAVGFVSGGYLDRKGAVSNELVHISDWYPTLVGLAGVGLNGTKPLDGVDQWEVINKGSASERRIILHNIDPLTKKRGKRKIKKTFDHRMRAAVRVGDLKLITGHPDRGPWLPPPESGLDAEEGIDDRPNQNLWLFNITADPNERNNLAKVKPRAVKRLLGVLKDFQATAVEPVYPDNDPNCHPPGNDGMWRPWQGI